MAKDDADIAAQRERQRQMAEAVKREQERIRREQQQKRR